MSLAAFLRRVVGALDEAGVPYMLTGSLAASVYAAPRATQDVDMVIETGRDALDRAVALLAGAGFYVDPGAAREALSAGGQFNAIDPDHGWKVDLIIRKDRPFSRTEFSRRRTGDLLGIEVSLATAEDLILAKLEWSTLGESERQLRDVVDLLNASWERLDRSYLGEWLGVLGLEEIWSAALVRAGRP